jgi:hypothetical protein
MPQHKFKPLDIPLSLCLLVSRGQMRAPRTMPQMMTQSSTYLTCTRTSQGCTTMMNGTSCREPTGDKRTMESSISPATSPTPRASTILPYLPHPQLPAPGPTTSTLTVRPLHHDSPHPAPLLYPQRHTLLPPDQLHQSPPPAIPCFLCRQQINLHEYWLRMSEHQAVPLLDQQAPLM